MKYLERDMGNLIFFLDGLPGIFLSESTKEKLSSFLNKLLGLLRLGFFNTILFHLNLYFSILPFFSCVKMKGQVMVWNMLLVSCSPQWLSHLPYPWIGNSNHYEDPLLPTNPIHFSILWTFLSQPSS